MGCEVQQCCCGCTLKTGSLVIGILEAIGSGIGLIVVIMAATSFSILRDTPMENTDATDEQIEDFHAAMGALAILMIVVAVILVVQLIFAILLACGASQEKPSLIKPWIIFAIVCLVLTIILYIISAGIAFANGQVTNGVHSIASCTLGTALKIYFIIVVRSFHLQLTQSGVKSFA